MKVFSGFIILALVLAALPHLNAAAPSGLCQMLIGALLADRYGNQNGNQHQPIPTYGISTNGCPQDMLQLNPVLSDLQTYGSQFGILVDCTASSEICTALRIYIDGKTFHSVLCSDINSALSQGMKHYNYDDCMHGIGIV